jgi:hypothetical protein
VAFGVAIGMLTTCSIMVLIMFFRYNRCTLLTRYLEYVCLLLVLVPGTCTVVLLFAMIRQVDEYRILLGNLIFIMNKKYKVALPRLARRAIQKMEQTIDRTSRLLVLVLVLLKYHYTVFGNIVVCCSSFYHCAMFLFSFLRTSAAMIR